MQQQHHLYALQQQQQLHQQSNLNVESGTTNQQRLKSLVQQFVNKMRKESDVFYKQFASFCKNRRDISNFLEFHHGMGELFKPYGDLLGDINKMLHADFQYDIPLESINCSLKNSEIANGSHVRKLSQYQSTDLEEKQFKSQQSRQIQQQPIANVKEFKEKFQQLCLMIKENSNDKLKEFTQALETKLSDQKEDLKLFKQTCSEIFGENHHIYKQFLLLFKDHLKLDNQTQPPLKQQQQHPQHGDEQIFPSSNKQDKNKKPKKNLNRSQNKEGNNEKHGNGKYHSNNNTSPNNKEVQPKSNSSKTQDFQNDFGRTPWPLPNRISSDQYSKIEATKNEQYFLYLIENYMDPVAQMNLLKLLYLYSECIITASEMIEQGAYLLRGFSNPEKLIEQLKEIVECRESSRRKSSTNFKPLNDLDFNNHQRFTHSYVEMPKFYPKVCSQSNRLSKEVLNTSIVTVPQGTEHVTFNIMRKNQYEEQLFKSEDEKYEYDRHIQLYKNTISTLKKIEICEDPQQCKKLVQHALDLKVLPCLYKNGSQEQHEIAELLLNYPKKTVSFALERIESKMKEIEDVKNSSAKKQWHEIAEKNFHRSLDHRSFIFKRHDRKFTLSSRFEKEPEFRNKMINKLSLFRPKLYLKEQEYSQEEEIAQQKELSKEQQEQHQLLLQQQSKDQPSGILLENGQDFDSDVNNYFGFLNTFYGTTNLEKCSHQSSEQHLIQFNSLRYPKKSCLPMMTFVFEDAAIVKDTFSLLMHFQAHSTINIHEKEKNKKSALLILKGILGFNFEQINPSEYVWPENKIIKVVTDIENKIFEKIFAYLRPIKDEENNLNQAVNQDGEDQDDQEKKSNTVAEENNQEDHPLPSKKHKQPKNPYLSVLAKQKDEQNQENNLSASSLNEMLEEENETKCEGSTVREMKYLHENIDENIFLPKGEDLQIFFGTKTLYVFLRFFYVLYERLYKAMEISKTFEDNEKTSSLTNQEKEELALERYNAFKAILITSLKTKESKYEDFLRSIFGKQAFLLFTIDKTLQSTTKSLSALSSDEIGNKVINLCLNNSTNISSDGNAIEVEREYKREELIYCGVNRIILESTQKIQQVQEQRSFFRFSRDYKSNIIYINYIDSYYKNWDTDHINTSKQYLYSYTTGISQASSENKNSNSWSSAVYLNRNKRKNEAKVQAKQIQIFQQNNIEYIAYPNSTHLANTSNQEDILISSQKLKRRHIPLEEAIEVEIQKKFKFDKWIERKTKEILEYK